MRGGGEGGAWGGVEEEMGEVGKRGNLAWNLELCAWHEWWWWF